MTPPAEPASPDAAPPKAAAPDRTSAPLEAAPDRTSAPLEAAPDRTSAPPPDDDDPDRDGVPSDERPSLPPALPPRFALPLAVAVTVVVGLALRYAFHADRAGEWSMHIVLFAVYAPLAVLAIFLILKEGKAAALLRPRRGDLTFAALVGGLMYGVAMAGRQLFLGAGTPRSWWVARIYLQLGDMSNNRILYVGLAVLLIAMLEELVWRGLVMRVLRAPFGPARAWLLSSVLYAVAHVGTISLLAHPVAGPNPLLVAAALGCGLVWGHLVNRTGRLVPAILAHGLFSWAIVDFPLWRP